MTVRDLAKAAGLHENTIYLAEQGRTSPTLSAITAWAGVLGLELVLSEVANKIVADGSQEAV